MHNIQAVSALCELCGLAECQLYFTVNRVSFYEQHNDDDDDDDKRQSVKPDILAEKGDPWICLP